MNNDTSNNAICKNVEYRTQWPWETGYIIIVNDKAAQHKEEIRRINKRLSGEADLPCQCPRCSTAT